MDRTFLVVQIVVVASAVVAGVAAIRHAGREERPVRAIDVILAAAAVGAVAAAGCVAGGVVGVRAFGAIRLLYLAGVVAIPLVALFLLGMRAARRLRTSPAALVLACVGLGFAALGVEMTFLAPYRLRLETATHVVAPARAGREDVRVGVLSDLQTDAIGDHERRAVDLLMAQRPDVILLPGDLIQATPDVWHEQGDALVELLSRLDAPGGVYFVVGDVDRTKILVPLLQRTKVRLLLDEVVRVKVRDRDVTLGGVSWHGRGVVEELETAPGDGDVRLLLVHRPDLVLELRDDTRVDLVVAGHTHGGQVVIPGFGPPMTLSSVPRHVAAGGLHRLGERAIYVSRGVGMERLQAPRMRLFCPPEVSVVTLAGAAEQGP